MADFPVGQFLDEQEKELAEGGGTWKAMSNNVSALGHPCERYLVYKRLCGDEAIPFPPKVVALMREGTEQEPFAIRLIQKRGYVYARSQEAIEIPDLQIRGKMDGVTYPKDTRNGIKWASEIKTVESMTYEKLNSVADLFESIWHKRWYVQLQLAIYHVSSKESFDDKGLLWIKSRSHQMIKPIQVPLDMKTIDETFEKCKRINQHLTAGTLPDYLPITEGMCTGCDMRLVCSPTEKYTAGANIEDANFEKKLRRREELQAAKSEYDKLDRTVKGVLKEAATEYAICGPFQITVKQNKTSKTINIDRVVQDEDAPPTPKAPEPKEDAPLSGKVAPWATLIQGSKTEDDLLNIKERLKAEVDQFTKDEMSFLSRLFSTVYDRVVKP